MKNKILPLLALSLLIAAGCVSILPGNEAIVVRAEQTQQYAIDTFDGFIHAERTYETLKVLGGATSADYRASAVHQFAEKCRKESLNWVTSVKVIIRSYKSNRTPENRQALTEALATLKVMLGEAEKYLVEISAEAHKPK